MLEKINSIIWGNGLIFLIMTTGIIYTVKTRVIQFKLLPYFIRNKPDKKQLRTMFMALGTAMGTGNITGVASAIAIGGAGALFWLWVSAFFGMALVYAENSLSSLYSSAGAKGTMATIENGLHSRGLAVVFAVFCVMASVGMGGMVQVNTFTVSLESCIHINKIYLFIIIFIVIYIVISGGGDRISRTAQVLLPFVSVLYMGGCLVSIYINKERLTYAMTEIFSQATGFRQTAGGVAGYTVSRAVSAGIRRGVFSNEAGLGSSPILHGYAENSPMNAMSAMLEVLFDAVCCTFTGLTVIMGAPVENLFGKYSGAFMALAMGVFAFCTITGWFYCGAEALSYISRKPANKAVCAVFALLASAGSVTAMKTVWTISDIFNGLMAFPNLTALILLMNKIKNISNTPDKDRR